MPNALHDTAAAMPYPEDYFGVQKVGSGLTYLYLSQVLSYSLKFCRQTGIRFRALTQTINRLTEAA